MKNEYQFSQGIFSEELGGPKPGSRLAQRAQRGGGHATAGGEEGQGAAEGGQGEQGAEQGAQGADGDAGAGATQHDEDAALCEEVEPLAEGEVRLSP
eukprot:7157540-Pyramimonas_sp.AAC.1